VLAQEARRLLHEINATDLLAATKLSLLQQQFGSMQTQA
jgi:hypothetical protein